MPHRWIHSPVVAIEEENPFRKKTMSINPFGVQNHRKGYYCPIGGFKSRWWLVTIDKSNHVGNFIYEQPKTRIYATNRTAELR